MRYPELSEAGRPVPLPRPAPRHPAADRLVLFLRAEVPAAERRAIVRHLLAGCPACVAVTRSAWAVRLPLAGERDGA
jgi:hypothetical protein